MQEVVLGLGSNRSFENKEPIALLAEACTALAAILHDCAYSSVYKTGALYVTDQDDFYNMVVMGGYEGNPNDLLNDVHIIERSLGRDRTKEFRNGPRPLDIDIELFGNMQVCQPDLVIPHERLMERAFVLKPLVEILRKYADGRIRDNVPVAHDVAQYECSLEKVKNQKIEKFLDASAFMTLLTKTGGSRNKEGTIYGTE